MIPLTDLEQQIINKINRERTIFCDESGAGCMAGDLFVAGVVLDPRKPIKGLNDSKKLTAKRRAELYQEIQEKALFLKVVSVTPEVIDRINILEARMMGFQTAIDSATDFIDYAVIDGNRIPKSNTSLIPTYPIVKGDAKIEEIAAASIIAKHERDLHIIEMSHKYPEYGFEKHKGYVTKLHKEMLEKYGACAIHRKSYKPVKDIITKGK